MKSLALDARWVIFGFMGGHRVTDFNLTKLFAKRGVLRCSSLKSRSDEYKAKLISQFEKDILGEFGKGFKPVTD